MLDLPSQLGGLLLYWVRVFWLALLHTWKLVIGMPLLSAAIALGIWTGTFLVHRALWGRESVTQDMRPALSGVIALLMVCLIVLTCSLIATPFRLFEDQQRLFEEQRRRAERVEGELRPMESELAYSRARVVELVQQLPSPELKPHQQQRLKEALEQIGEFTVSIEYLDTATSRSGGLAWSLAQVFRSAGWHVQVYPVKRDPRHFKRLSMRTETGPRHVKPQEQAVLDAFQSIDLACGSLVDGQNVGRDRVELLIGEM
jgi:hypothetical protein